MPTHLSASVEETSTDSVGRWCSRPAIRRPRYDQTPARPATVILSATAPKMSTGLRRGDREALEATAPMSDGFQQALDQIRADAGSHAERGAFFERLMKRYFRHDPVYTDRFSDVWLWSEWAARRPEFAGQDKAA